MASRKAWKTLESPTSYTVGWIAALPLERAAALVMLDERHNKPKGFVPNQSDNNVYSWGRIAAHNIVITSLPEAEYGKGSAAITANGLLSSLPHIRIGLLVGIGAGVPTRDDILLGDVVISTPDNTNGGVVQYDLYKAKKKNQSGERERKGFLNSPPRALRAALSALRAEHEVSGSEINDILVAFHNNENTRKSYGFPGADQDQLRTKFDSSRLTPSIHYGMIASGDILVKDASQRDELVGWLRSENIHPLCFEMEAASLMNSFPCLVIRGICDYADEHKNDIWQRYAAATAAAFAKEFLAYVDDAEVIATAKIGELLEGVKGLRNDIEKGVSTIQSSIENSRTLTQLRSGLRIAQGATYNSHQDEHYALCLKGTREKLLEQISAWYNNPDGRCIFWLCGKAGTGKSTIARTVAYHLDHLNRLGASFFFKRGEGDRSNASCFVSTIVRQLIDKIPDAGKSITATLEADSLLCDRGLQQQFEKLLLQPFSSLSVHQVPSSGLIVVIDALDECEGCEDIHKILKLLSRVSAMSPLHLRVFVTSRPELPLQLGFQQLDGSVHQDVILEEVQTTTIEHDIRKYFEHQFDKIRESAAIWNSTLFVPGWPGDDNIQALVNLAVPLFIVAVTVCRYVSKSNPEERLKTILEQRYNPSLSSLGKTYMPILQAMILDHDIDERKQAVTDFQNVVGTIVLLLEPLPIVSLSALLGISIYRISHILNGLHSLLHVSHNAPIRLLHLSFRDFLVESNSTQAREFHVDERQTHARLSDHCLSYLKRSGILKQDICGLQKPGIRRIEVNREKVKDCIPAELAYACSYWPVHVVQSEQGVSDGGRVHEFLQLHFLHWLEVLSWLDRLSSAIGHITQLRLLVKDDQHSKISAFLDDALRFILNNRHIIDLTPLQLYQSALLFIPTNSIVRKTFQNKHHAMFSLSPDVSMHWTAEILKLESPESRFWNVVFSPDGKLLATTAIGRSVRLWDTSTGKEVQMLEGGAKIDGPPVFSPFASSKLLAAASKGPEIGLWDISTGRQVRVLKGHKDAIQEMAFSSLNVNLLVSTARDHTVRLWDISSGREVQGSEMFPAKFEARKFSHNGQLALINEDGRTWLWDLNANQNIPIFKGNVKLPAFSHDDTLLALVPPDNSEVNICNTKTGHIVYTYKLNGRIVDSIALSRESRLLALALLDCSIELWDLDTGKVEQILNKRGKRVADMAFSPDGKMLASGLVDDVVRLWDTSIGHEPELFPQYEVQHEQDVCMTIFSANGEYLATTSYDGKEVFIWEVSTTRILWLIKQSLQQDGSKNGAITFSPITEELLAIAETNAILLVDVKMKQEVLRIDPTDIHTIHSIVFSPDGKYFVSLPWSYKNITKVWTTATGQKRWVEKDWIEDTDAIAFSPDGKLIASASKEEGIRVWQTDTWQEVRLEGRGGSRILDLIFSPDSNMLASTSGDGMVKVWQTSTWEKVQRFVHPSLTISFAADNRTLLTESDSLHIDGAPVSASLQDKPQQSFLAIKKDWVQWQGEDVLWLPYDYRPNVVAWHKNIIALGQKSGRVSFLKLLES